MVNPNLFELFLLAAQIYRQWLDDEGYGILVAAGCMENSILDDPLAFMDSCWFVGRRCHRRGGCPHYVRGQFRCVPASRGSDSQVYRVETLLSSFQAALRNGVIASIIELRQLLHCEFMVFHRSRFLR